MTVSRTFASVCMSLSGISSKIAPSSFQDQGHNSTSIPSIHSVPAAPLLNTSRSQGASAGGLYVQGSNDDASVNRLALPIASFPGSRVAELRRQHLSEDISSLHIAASQSNPGPVSSIRNGDAGSSSQPIGNAIIPNSPRRTRSQGLTNAYRLCYRRQGFEQS